MIVDKAIYREGRREEITGDISDTFARAKAEGDALLWIGLTEPSPDEFDLVADELGLHPLSVEDAVHAHQRPKLERYGDHVFLVIKTFGFDPTTTALDTGEIMIFIGPDFVITVRHGAPNPLTSARARFEADARLLAAGPAGVLYAVCDDVVDTYSLIAGQVDTNVADVERQVFEPGRTDVTEAIYALKRQVLQLKVAVDPLAPVLEELTKERVAYCSGLPEYFRDVLDHTLRVERQIGGQSELLTSALTAQLALVTVRQNTDVRKISAWAAVIAVPTFVVGIYGMNFDHMPELHWRVGYPLVMGLIALVCSLIYLKMRKSGWL